MNLKELRLKTEGIDPINESMVTFSGDSVDIDSIASFVEKLQNSYFEGMGLKTNTVIIEDVRKTYSYSNDGEKLPCRTVKSSMEMKDLEVGSFGTMIYINGDKTFSVFLGYYSAGLGGASEVIYDFMAKAGPLVRKKFVKK